MLATLIAVMIGAAVLALIVVLFTDRANALEKREQRNKWMK
jgi:hypothetical protein